MAKRKEERYRFIASESKIKIPDNIRLHDVLLINNATDGIIIGSQLDPGKGFSITHFPPPVTDADFIYAIDGYTEIVLEYDTTGMSDTDELSIYLDDKSGLTVRPFPFGTDAIERIRTSNPQSLIDADFEYGLQNTKWQSIGLNRNIPSFFEFPGPALLASDIASQGAATYSTIRVTVETGTALAVGTPVSITGTTNPLAEGLFVVVANNSPTLSTFDVLAKGSIATGSVYTAYSVVKQGGIYAGTPMDLSTMSGNGAGGKVTVVFGSPHGLVPGSPLTVSDTAAGAQSHEGSFFVEQVVNGTTVIYDAGQTVTSGSITTTNITVYARNDSFFTHRPFDGGVLMGPALPIHGLEAKRQTKRYFRYQSGKGILFSTGTLFNPVFDIQTATYSSPDISVTTQIPHGVQKGAEVRIYGITSANYNGEYVVKEITSEYIFKVTPVSAPTDATAVLEAQPRVAVTKWVGACIRCGIFDDDNGIFWEYDGQELAVVRRSSTFQLAGTVALSFGSQAVTGTNTRFTEQLKVGDKIVIRGQSYLVSTITNNTTLSVSPENRGATVSGVKPTIVREIRVPQSKFNYDRIDGVNSPSGYNVNLAKMQMLGIQYSWYGAGFIDFMLRGPLGEFITVHRMANNNINDEAYMRSGNLPARYEVVNTSAIDKLSVNTGLTTTSLNLLDASRFPVPPVGISSNYVMITSNQSGTTFQEVLSYAGKSGNTLTGVTTATSYSQYLAGATRTFTGVSSSQNHPAGSSVILLNNTCAPTISHWGSAIIMDGGFDNDDGYQFNYARTNITINGNTSTTVLLFRAAPSVSDTIPGFLGQREVINRSQIKFREIEVNNVSSRNLQISAILNPTNVGAATWENANTRTVGGASVFQPSFAQVASSGGTILGGTAPANGEILFQFLSTTGTTTFDLREIKEVQNSIIGGDNTYPDGPEVVAFYITNNNNQAAVIDVVLKWTEAQA